MLVPRRHVYSCCGSASTGTPTPNSRLYSSTSEPRRTMPHNAPYVRRLSLNDRRSAHTPPMQMDSLFAVYLDVRSNSCMLPHYASVTSVRLPPQVTNNHESTTTSSFPQSFAPTASSARNRLTSKPVLLRLTKESVAMILMAILVPHVLRSTADTAMIYSLVVSGSPDRAPGVSANAVPSPNVERLHSIDNSRPVDSRPSGFQAGEREETTWSRIADNSHSHAHPSSTQLC